MTTCGCKLYGNQYGSRFRLCEEHSLLVETAAHATGESVEALFNRVVQEHVERIFKEHDQEVSADEAERS